MSFKYEPPHHNEFRQGEILADVREYRPVHPAEEGAPVEIQPVIHTRVVMIAQDCDLLSDFQQRSTENHEHHNILQHLLICDLFETDEIRTRMIQTSSKEWRQIRQNQNERYHQLPAGPIGDGDSGQLSDLYLDFKRLLSIPTEDLYRDLDKGNVKRIAVVPPIYIQDLIHRLYAFHGRIALPEPDEEQ